MASKRKTLPKDFEALLEAGDLAQLKAVFDRCEIDARGGPGKHTALGYDRCPDDLVRWLVAHGADVNAVDTWGNTPLHTRARSVRSRIDVLFEVGCDVNAATSSLGTPLHAAADGTHATNVSALLAHGAQVDAKNRDGLTPLELGLQRCGNVSLARMAEVARVLLDAGAQPSARAKGFVRELGERFEFHRAGFAKDRLPTVSAGLDALYAMFEVPAVARREIHDGSSDIVATGATWQAQHEQLWNLLVPSTGAAATVQGEVVRIAGRISDEILRNGGINWDDAYREMARAWLAHVQTGTALSAAQIAEATELVAALTRLGRSGPDALPDTYRLAELGVAWVAKNPRPLALTKPDYRR